MNDIWTTRHRRSDLDYPLWLSLRYLGSFTTETVGQHALVVVCGHTYSDFALFWTLRALRGANVVNTFWIPSLESTAAVGRYPFLLSHAMEAQLRKARDRRIEKKRHPRLRC